MGDSLPAHVHQSIAEDRRAWIAAHAQPWTRGEVLEYTEKFPKRIDLLLDQGSGSCLLKNPDAAGIAAACLEHFDGVQYRLDSYVVMPNHVHILARLSPDHGLSKIVQAWKGVSSKRIIKRFGVEPPFWQDGYWDRLIRDATHLRRCRQYIADNPSKARLRDGEFVVKSSSASNEVVDL